MKLIPLTRGYFAQVDDADFEWLNQWKWCARVTKYTVYAERTTMKNGRKVGVIMHRDIMNVNGQPTHVDHKDGNGLNNTRENIRLCTRSQNMMNRSGAQNSSSIFKGVAWHKSRKDWVAYITIDGVVKHIGRFKNEEDAARVYNQFARKLHGEFVKYNDVFPMFPDSNHDRVLLRANNTTGFRGVRIDKRRGRWNSEIGYMGKKIHIGTFSDVEMAAMAYDIKASELYGKDARLNYPPRPNESPDPNFSESGDV